MDFKSIFFVLILQIVLTFYLSAAVTQAQPQLENFQATVTNFSSDLYQVIRFKCLAQFCNEIQNSPLIPFL